MAENNICGNSYCKHYMRQTRRMTTAQQENKENENIYGRTALYLPICRRLFADKGSNLNDKPATRDVKVSSRDVTASSQHHQEECMDWDESVKDYDDTDNPDMCGEYCKDIFKNEMEREVKWVFGRITDPKRARLRMSCVDWLIEISASWDLATDTLFVAVMLLEKSLRVGKWSIEDMQTLAGTCLLLAAKVEEINCLPISDIVDIAPSTSHEIIKQCEKRILIEQEYEMITPHLMLFLRRFNYISESDHKTHTISKYLATLVLRYQGHCSFLQSVLAAAICFISRRLVGYTEAEAWANPQILYSGYSYEEIEGAVHFVADVIAATLRYAGTQKAPAAYKVYSSSRHGRVSLDTCMAVNFIDAYSFQNTGQPLEGQ